MKHLQALLLSCAIALALLNPLEAMEMVSDKTITITLADNETATIPESEWNTLKEMISYKDIITDHEGPVILPALTKSGLESLMKHLSIIKKGGVPLNELLLTLLKDESSQEFHELMIAADYLGLDPVIDTLVRLFDGYFIFTFPPQYGYSISGYDRAILKRILALPIRLRANKRETIERIFLSAAEHDDEDTLNLLLDEDWVDSNCRDTIKQTALIKAIKNSKSKKLVEYLLEKGADISLKDISGTNALMIAASCPGDCIDLVTFIFNKGAGKVDVNEAALNGYTALMHASEVGNTQVVEFLLAQSADAAQCDMIKRNALVIACGSTNDCTEVVRVLLSHKGLPKLDINETIRGRNALTEASSKGREKIVELLLNAGACRGLNKALSLAQQGHHQGVAQLLIQHGAIVTGTEAETNNEQTLEGWLGL